MNYEDFYQDLQPYEKSVKDSLSSLQKLFKAVSRETESGDVKSLARDLNAMEAAAADIASSLKKLVGVVTLGWGTRPRHTIQRIFPSLDTKDYLEIGRMCMTEEMPRNSESQMLSQLVKWIRKNIPELKILFT